ncbi:Uncharacterised protein [Mycolicibacterium vanbaalenii]|uniref:Uncharacterized protein n=1 Tax=Mycolicibacterium vanbaalenii TaxID=110539 RepID=A0A5S9R8M1_MYCVN|nr:hypothetical protein [Mycolicibacterium vanbaalenii]CAA0089701.1 Uncharacterised protein [Mycolicibacterium vanbaalenii]CAA0133781.1 Uncharacterised protein [Mycolicibacterium vanbaalenii]
MTEDRIPEASRRLDPRGEHGAGDDRLHRVRLLVPGAGVGEVVRSVGGFLCDRARAGWDVRVLLTAPCDTRALRILGIAAHELDADLLSVIEGLSRGGALALGADVLARDADSREQVSRLISRGRAEVTVWGRPTLGNLTQGLEPVAHPMSAAARAFKAHALRAIGGATDSGAAVEPHETLFRVRGSRRRRSL